MTTRTTRGRPRPGAAPPSSAAASAFTRATSSDYFAWLDHVWPAAACTHPVRLHGSIRHIDTATGEILRDISTENLPDGLIYKACGNRRATTCPACAETYRRDAYQVIRSGLAGGHGAVPGGTHRPRRARACCCSDRTPTSPRVAASMPSTAAASPCTVVTHGTPRRTAAVRIS